MVRDQTCSGPGVVEWSLPDDEIGDVRARLPYAVDDLEPDDARTPWCPVCAARTTMRAVATPAGRRFDLCDGCGLLLEVDRPHGRVVAHRVAAPCPSDADRMPTEASPAVTTGGVPPAGRAGLRIVRLPAPTTPADDPHRSAATPARIAAPTARVPRPHRRAGAGRPRAARARP